METNQFEEKNNNNSMTLYEKQLNEKTSKKSHKSYKSLKIKKKSKRYIKNKKQKIIYTSSFSIIKTDNENQWKILLNLPEDDQTKSFILSGIYKILMNAITLTKSNPYYTKIIQLQNLNYFSLRMLPNDISLKSFIDRIFIYSNIEYTTLFLGLIYLQKFLINSSLFLTEYNVFKLIGISILIANKYNEDKVYCNDYYSKIIGISLEELNLLEGTYLDIINYELYLGKEEINSKFRNIYQEIILG